MTSPLVERHPHTGRTILRFSEEVETDLNPVSLRITGLSGQTEGEFMTQLRHRIDKQCYAHAWQEGDFLIADNHQLIHGRNAFFRATPRHIRRAQIL